MICLPTRTLFILGTAQLGTKYGIANFAGKPDDVEASSIIKEALNSGVSMIDTATLYGDAEERIGSVMRTLSGVSLDVITKIMPQAGPTEQIISQVDRSRKKLSVEKLFAVLSHHWQGASASAVQTIFNGLKTAQLCQYTGVSVYNGSQALTALKLKHVDIVQMPLNVLDRQAVEMKVIDRAKSLGKMLVFRSVYLQGFLLLEPDKLPGHMAFAHDILVRWREILSKYSITPRQAALSIALRLADGFPLVIGCENAAQVRTNVESINRTVDCLQAVIRDTAALTRETPEQLRNPALW